MHIIELLLDGMWPRWKWVADRFSSPKRCADFLGIYAPLTVIILLLSWGLALIFGYGLLFLALQSELHPQPNDLGTALYFSGTSVLTLGFGDIVATGGITRILALCAGASGLAIVSGVISMFFSLYSSLGHREVQVMLLRHRAGSPPSRVTLLETYARVSWTPAQRGRGLGLGSTATHDSVAAVVLWLHRPTHRGVLTKHPCSSSPAGRAASAKRHSLRQSNRHGG